MAARIKPGASGARMRELRERIGVTQRQFCDRFPFLSLRRLQELEQERSELTLAESAMVGLLELRPHMVADMLADAGVQA